MFDFFKKHFKKDDIGEPPYLYDILVSLDKSEYPKYLKRMYKANTGENLNLKHPKTFNEKIQWLKLFDTTPLKTQLTDKVSVRDWVKEKIGEEYLKPVLQICKNFDELNFESFPEEFIIKANHGCKWHYIIRNKQKFLETKQLYDLVKLKFDNWQIQTFFPWAGFEMQYEGIDPKIIAEPLLTDKNAGAPVEYEILCFNGEPSYIQKITFTMPAKVNVWGKDFTYTPIKMSPSYIKEEAAPDENLKKAVELSKVLAKDFKLVRVDWLVQGDKFYFNEMTFTPMSGFYTFEDKAWNKQLGKMLDLKK